MSTGSDSWPQVLAALEADIAAVEATLAAGRLPAGGSSYDPPTQMEPLPPELVLRAWEAHDRALAVSRALEDATHKVGAALTALTAQRTERPDSTYLDARF